MVAPERGARARTPLAALLVLAAALALYGLTLPTRLYGDDVWFVRCLVQAEPFTSHFLYLPLARGVTALAARAAGADPFLALRLLAATGAALGAALGFAAARRRRLAPGRAACFAALPATSAAGWFFATAAELHALHAGAVGLFAWTLARLRPTSPPRGWLAVGLAFSLVVGTHQSGVLLLPGAMALAWLASGPRPWRGRAAQLGWLGLAGLAGLGFMALCTWVESGRWLAGGDTLELLKRGLPQRARELGWRALAGYVSEDAVLPAAGLALAGSFALGALVRARPAPGLASLACVLPYLLFFPLFHFPERGAYYLVCLPVLAGALVALAAPPDEPAAHPSPPPALVLAVLALAAAAALFRPDELAGLLGPLAPAAAALALFLLGLAAGGRRAPDARAARSATALLALLALLPVASAAGALRALRHYDRTTPLLDWTRDVCEAGAGRDVVLVTCGFQEYWLLVLLRSPWPAPYAGTWDFARSLPLPGPAPFLYGDPTVSREELRAGVAARLARGEEVWLDERVPAFLATRPPAERERSEVDLDWLRGHHRLEPLERGSFRGWRLLAP